MHARRSGVGRARIGGEVRSVIIEYDSPHLSQKYETEIPCAADPRPFAISLIKQARENDLHADKMESDEEELRWCRADDSPFA